ncbi:hypothetical protein J27TS7_48740 [Paenibacillus dendritiformis]|nr:hypothetical protein J27TS7_48740 [Paenibacillus dendritiformis]
MKVPIETVLNIPVLGVSDIRLDTYKMTYDSKDPINATEK